jgi:hypothetical protein
VAWRVWTYVTVSECVFVIRLAERGKKPRRFLPRPFSEAGRITLLALNIQMRASEPEDNLGQVTSRLGLLL